MQKKTTTLNYIEKFLAAHFNNAWCDWFPIFVVEVMFILQSKKKNVQPAFFV